MFQKQDFFTFPLVQFAASSDTVNYRDLAENSRFLPAFCQKY